MDIILTTVLKELISLRKYLQKSNKENIEDKNEILTETIDSIDITLRHIQRLLWQVKMIESVKKLNQNKIEHLDEQES